MLNETEQQVNDTAEDNAILSNLYSKLYPDVPEEVIKRVMDAPPKAAARFTLETMPAKQMSIDADLNAKRITEDEARQRREDIQKEADLYGAIEGLKVLYEKVKKAKAVKRQQPTQARDNIIMNCPYLKLSANVAEEDINQMLRTAEVSTRFTFDATPFKQMSVDADLRAKRITEDEAHQRREDIQKEIDFYKAIEGALKFAKYFGENSKDIGCSNSCSLGTLIKICIINMVARKSKQEKELAEIFPLLESGISLAEANWQLLCKKAGVA